MLQVKMQILFRRPPSPLPQPDPHFQKRIFHRSERSLSILTDPSAYQTNIMLVWKSIICLLWKFICQKVHLSVDRRPGIWYIKGAKDRRIKRKDDAKLTFPNRRRDAALPGPTDETKGFHDRFIFVLRKTKRRRFPCTVKRKAMFIPLDRRRFPCTGK